MRNPILVWLGNLFKSPTRKRVEKRIAEIEDRMADMVIVTNQMKINLNPQQYVPYACKIGRCKEDIKLLESVLSQPGAQKYSPKKK